jgi:hypothetical protein
VPFFSWKILCIGQNHIFQIKIWQNFAKQKTTNYILFCCSLQVCIGYGSMLKGSGEINSDLWQREYIKF